MDMIEKVARALAADIERVGPARTRMEWDDLTTLAKATMMIRARAAIEAMREPSEAMVSAAFAADGTNMPLAIGYDEAWRAMIDAALTPSPASR